MYIIPQDRLGIYHRLNYVQNTTVQVGYISYTGLRTERLDIYHRLSYVQNTTGQVGYIS
jgi:hypothetical protein